METAVAARISTPERQISGNSPSDESKNNARNTGGKTQSFSALFSSSTEEDKAETDTRSSRVSSSDTRPSDDNDKDRRANPRNGLVPLSSVPVVADLFTLLPLSLRLPIGLGLGLSGSAGPEAANSDSAIKGKNGPTLASTSSDKSVATEEPPVLISYGDVAFGLHLSSVTPESQSEYSTQKLLPGAVPKVDPGQRPQSGAASSIREAAAITSEPEQVSLSEANTPALKDPPDSAKHTPDVSALPSIVAVSPDSGLANGGDLAATGPGTHASQPTSALAASAAAVNEIHTAEAPRSVPVRQISIDLPGADLPKVAVQLTERNGDLRVAVRTADANLAGDLRLELKDLVGNLKQQGFKVESWAPAAPVGETQTHSHDHRDSGNNDQQQNSRGGDTDRGDGNPRDQRRQRQAYPAWIAEFENHTNSMGTGRTQNS